MSRRRPIRLNRPAQTAAVIVVALVAVVMAGSAMAKVTNADPAVSGSRSDWTPQPEVEKHSLFVIGDSWTEGGTMNTGPTWPGLLDLPDGWNVLTDGVGGSGYIGDHSDSALTYGGRLRDDLRDYAPDVVLVAMGRNDLRYDPDAVARAASDDLTEMREAWPTARLVVFSPFSPEVPAAPTVALTNRLRELADSMGLPYLDVSGVIGDRPRLIESSHPNDAGQAVLAEAIQFGLTDLGAFD